MKQTLPFACMITKRVMLDRLAPRAMFPSSRPFLGSEAPSSYAIEKTERAMKVEWVLGRPLPMLIQDKFLDVIGVCGVASITRGGHTVHRYIPMEDEPRVWVPNIEFIRRRRLRSHLTAVKVVEPRNGHASYFSR